MQSGDGKRKVTRVAAYCLVVQDDRILLCRISAAVPNAVGKWTLPGGGIDFGEDPKDAAVRETLEETGLNVRLTELVDINSLVLDGSSERFHGLRVVYRAEVASGELTCEIDGSTDECGWFTVEEAQRLPLVDLARSGIKLAFREE